MSVRNEIQALADALRDEIPKEIDIVSLDIQVVKMKNAPARVSFKLGTTAETNTYGQDLGEVLKEYLRRVEWSKQQLLLTKE